MAEPVNDKQWAILFPEHVLICPDCDAEYRGAPNDCPHCR